MRTRLGIINRAADMISASLHKPLEIEGIDVSHHQGDIDWEKVADSGIRFAYIRATQGVDFVDRKVRQNLSVANGVMPHGVYHFGSWYNADERKPAIDARAEAEHFVKTSERYQPLIWARGHLPPVLDVELSGSAKKTKWDRWNKKPGDHMSYAAVTEWILAFCDRCDELTGRTTAIYTGRYFVFGDPSKSVRGIGPGNIPALSHRPLWLAQYNSGSAPRRPLQSWRTQIWQYTGSGSCPGIKGRVDRNAFMGSRADFLRLLGYVGDARRAVEMGWVA